MGNQDPILGLNTQFWEWSGSNFWASAPSSGVTTQFWGISGPPPRCHVPTGEVAAPYFTGHVTDRVTQEDATAAVWPLVLVGLGRWVTLESRGHPEVPVTPRPPDPAVPAVPSPSWPVTAWQLWR